MPALLAPAAPPIRSPRTPVGFLPGLFTRRLEREWLPTMPPYLRRGRFLALLYAAAVHADPYGLVLPAIGLDVPATLARSAGLSAGDGHRYLSAALAAGLMRHTAPDRWTLGSPTPPAWTAALDVLTAPSPLEAPRAC
ncbi:hypothetical protein KYY02_31160 [Streptomyces pimonensis]|uniref:Uncharacterized protein n=1 Tax=Streptomyces pimonensis TaxID=2860288 RepID=A0ABV4J7N5_9ACTN